jgi:hypothetical protein
MAAIKIQRFTGSNRTNFPTFGSGLAITSKIHSVPAEQVFPNLYARIWPIAERFTPVPRAVKSVLRQEKSEFPRSPGGGASRLVLTNR